MARPRSPGVSLEIIIAATPLATFVSSAVAAQSLGPSGRGLLSTLTVWTQGVALMAFLSLDKGMIAAGTATDADDGKRATLRTSLRRDVAALTLAAGAIGATVVGLLTGRLWAVAVVGVATALTCRAEWAAGVAMASGHWLAFKSWRVVQPLVFALSVVAVAVLGRGLRDEGRTIAMAVGFALSVLAGAALLWIFARGTASGESSSTARGEIWRFASRYHVTTVATILAFRVDLLIAPVLFTFTQVGQYAVAVAPGAVLATIGSAALLRGLTDGPSAPSRRPLAPLLLVIATLVVGVAAMPIVLPLIFGNDFRPAVGAAQVLLGAGALGYLTQWQTGRMAARGLPAWAAAPQLLTAGSVLVAAFASRSIEGLAGGVLVGRVLALVAGVAIVQVHTRQQAVGRDSDAFSEETPASVIAEVDDIGGRSVP